MTEVIAFFFISIEPYMTLQQDTIQYYARNPGNKFVLPDADISYEEMNRLCGDDVSVYLKLMWDKVTAWSFDGSASMITIACCAIFWELIIGMRCHEVLSLRQKDVITMTGIEVSPRRKRAQVIWLLATQNALLKLSWSDEVRDFSDVLDVD